MKNILTIISLFLLLLIQSCTTPPEEQAAELITAETLLAHVDVLASDEFEGRAPATRGEDLTVEYLVSQLEELEVEPGMEDGTYIQQVPLLGQQVDGESADMNFKKGGQVAEDLEIRTDFMAWPSNEAERVQLRDAELLYVGYGIQAPEFDWNDYKDMDVEGKVLVFKNSDPANNPDIFEGDSRLYYGRWSYKFEKAEEMGALGAIIIHTTPTAGYGWSVVENSWGRERFMLVGDDPDGQKPEFNAWLTEEQGERMFELAGMNLHEQLEQAENRDFRPVLLEGVTLDIDLSAEYSSMATRNVLGKIEGSDPELMDEYLVFTAHYDHLGVTTPVDGDSINNGALDNAAGVSAVLNLARAYKEVEPEMRRSALFLFVGAEEMGLLGSKYWAANPTIHPGKVTANLNMDGMQVYGETEDVVLVGYGRNTITDVIKNYAERDGRMVKPDPNPEQGFFYRSDHFSLARLGIPAIFPNPGRDYINKPDGYIDTVDSLGEANYHSVGDEVNEYWDLSGMQKDVRLFFKTGFHILNSDEMMKWESGDEFEAVRQDKLEEVR